MSSPPSFESAWFQPEFELPDEEPQLCPYAERFLAIAQELVSRATANPTELRINVSKLHLLDRYWAFYVSIPKQHQNHVGNRGGHTCIFQVFMSAYNALHVLALSISPPKVVEAPPPPQLPPPSPPPPLQIAGIFIGEDE